MFDIKPLVTQCHVYNRGCKQEIKLLDDNYDCPDCRHIVRQICFIIGKSFEQAFLDKSGR